MARTSSDIIAGRLKRPDPIDGLVTEIDFGFDDAIVVSVVKDGELWVETYQLADVAQLGSSSE